MGKTTKSKTKKKDSLLVKIISPKNNRLLLLSCIAISLLAGTAYVTYSLAAGGSNPYLYVADRYHPEKNSYNKSTKCVNFTTSVYRPGSSGPCVRAIQWYLNQKDTPYGGLKKAGKMQCPKLTIDGKYGPSTAEAVRSYQRTHYTTGGGKLTADGVVGKGTWNSFLGYRASAKKC